MGHYQPLGRKMEIGISQPAIFRHFPAKADIWEAVGDRICRLMGELQNPCRNWSKTA